MSREDTERYNKAAHAMQTGVAYELGKGDNQASPKHLRVGVNAAMSDHGGLVRLLLAKGIITESEYEKAIADAMEEERDRYQARMPPRMTLI